MPNYPGIVAYQMAGHLARGCVTIAQAQVCLIALTEATSYLGILNACRPNNTSGETKNGNFTGVGDG